MLKLSDTLYVDEAQIGVIRCIPAHMTRRLPGDGPSVLVAESFVLYVGEWIQEEIEGDAAVALRAWLDHAAKDWSRQSPKEAK